MLRLSFESILIAALLAGAAGCNGKSSSASAGAPVIDAGQADGPRGDGHTLRRLATGLGSPTSLAVDADYAYLLISYPAPSITRVPLDGGSPASLATSPVPTGLAIDSTTVYWTDEDVDGGAVLGVPKAGGTVTTLAGGLPPPGPIAVQGSAVYWASSGSGGAACDAGCAPSVATVAKTGGAISTLYTGPASSFPDAIVAHGSSVYLSTSDGRIVDIPDDGGASKLLRYELTSNEGIADDDAYVYWVNTSGNVMKIAVDGGAATVLAYSQQTGSIAVDSTGVYWPNSGDGDGTVMMVQLDGGAPVTIAAGLGYPQGIALGPAGIYWFNDQGELWEATPK
jgi:sugar lactone lactonase YvrE